MRKNIFEIFAENNTIQHDLQRIDLLYSKRIYAKYGEEYFTLKEMAEEWFPCWKNRGRCLSYSDYINTIDYDNIIENAVSDEDAFITFTSAQISQILRKLVKSALKLDKSNENYSNCYLN